MSEVMNVLGDECRGDECRTIKVTACKYVDVDYIVFS